MQDRGRGPTVRLPQSASASALRTVRSRSLPPRAMMAIANIFVGALLRSPLHRVVSKTLLLLTYTGRESGKQYRLPVGYRRDGALVTLIAGNPWWINLRGGAAVTLHLAGVELRGVATPVEDKGQAGEMLMAFLEKMPHLAKMYNATQTPDKRPDPASVKAAVNTQVVVRVALGNTAPPI